MQQVLIVKLSSLGDVIHTLPALTEAAECLDGKVDWHWVIEENYSEIPSWHSAISEVIPFGQRRIRKLNLVTKIQGYREYIQRIRRQQYDYIIDAQGLIKSAFFGAWCARGKAYGFNADCARESLASLAYEEDGHFVDPNLHMIERIRKLFANTLGYRLANELPSFGIKHKFKDVPKRNSVLFFHGSANQSKLVDEKKWIEMGKLLNSRGLTPELPWATAQELDQAKRIGQACSGKILPQMKLGEIAESIAGCTGAIGLDTGLTHLAAALEIPCVGLYTTTAPERTGNLGVLQHCLAGANKVECQQIIDKLFELRLGVTN